MKTSRVRHLERGTFVLAILAVVATVVLLPFAIVSLVGSLQKPSGLRAYEIGTPSVHTPDHLAVNIDAVALNELAHTVTLRVSGLQVCHLECGSIRRIRLYSMGANPRLSQGVPPSVYLDIPGDQTEIDTNLSLPIEGSLASYPFDNYSLYLGVSVARLSASGQEIPVSPEQQQNVLALSFGEEIPRVDMGAPTPTAPIGLHPPDPYGFTAHVNFGRPLYLQILTVLLIMLLALAATYAVLLRPFDQLITSTGVIVLGLWGARSLLVGGYTADSTAVDLFLIVIMMLLLLVIAVRGVAELKRKAFPHEGPDKETAAETATS